MKTGYFDTYYGASQDVIDAEAKDLVKESVISRFDTAIRSEKEHRLELKKRIQTLRNKLSNGAKTAEDGSPIVKAIVECLLEIEYTDTIIGKMEAEKAEAVDKEEH